jgi:hypothetical protein
MRKTLLGVGVVVVVASGCTHTFAQDVVEPNPLVVHDPTARTSERITITRGDVDLLVPVDKIPQRQAEANATPEPAGHERPMVDNIKRESVGEFYRWPLESSASWTMVSSNDLRFHIAIDHKWLDYVDVGGWSATLEDDQGHVYTPAAVEHRRARLLYGDNTAGDLSIYRGLGDIVFRQPGLLTANRRWIKLTLHHGVDQFVYTWRFQSDVAAR